jgi:hypothetical protein
MGQNLPARGRKTEKKQRNGLITKMQKWGGSFKNLLLQNHRARRAHMYMKAF